ncbi:AtuA-related protein [Halobaculum sp. EA56]|uniref:AtuA-related protein n=1 Tax=Halobaculum sp. EA56 TaxID=3421648 RepID=UPI003EBD67D6
MPDETPSRSADPDRDDPLCIGDIAHGRSGDKGNRLNIGLVAEDAQAYERLTDQVTASFVAEQFDGLVEGAVTRYELPNLHAFNFLCERALDGGGPVSLRYDTQGKTYAAALLECRLPPYHP